MRTLTILLSFLVVGLAIGWFICYLSPQFWPQYTAEAFIRVLPGNEKATAATLIKNQNALTLLTDRDKVQQTGLFQKPGKTKDERLKKCLSELKEHLSARPIPCSDLIRISMTCSNGADAALITNEAANMLLSTQGSEKRKLIANNLAAFDEQQTRIQKDLDMAERVLDDVRRRYGFADLEQHDYPHPITARLMRLEAEEDDCLLDMNQLKTHREILLGQPQQILPSGKPDPNQAAEMKNVEFQIKLTQGKLEELRKMHEAAQIKEDELELARAQYEQRRHIRDERQAALDSVKTRVEEVKTLHDNPDVSRLEIVDLAVIPQEADYLPWQIVVPIAAGAGLIIGIICALLTGKAKKPN